MAIHVFEKSLPLDVSREDAFRWHMLPGALPRLTPPWMGTKIIDQSGDIADSTRTVTMKTKLPGGVASTRVVARHTDFVDGEYFVDTMEKGPFSHWKHTHRFEGEGSTSTMVDHIEWAPPRLTDNPLTRRIILRQLEQMFTYRHETTRLDILAHARAGTDKQHVLIAGGSGFIGSQLVAYLTGAGHSVTVLTRNADREHLLAPAARYETWDPATGQLDESLLAEADTVINLAGAPIAQRWTKSARAEILSSRVDSTGLLATTMAGLPDSDRPALFIACSATGYYGETDDGREGDDPGTGYLADVCVAWEDAAQPAQDAGIRVVHPRIGIVLSSGGGTLDQLLLPFKLGVGGPIGMGRDILSWVSLQDVLGAMEFFMGADDVDGPVNLVGPHPVSWKEFARTLGSILRRPAIIPTPPLAIGALYGRKFVDEAITTSQHISAQQLVDAGFAHAHDTAEAALAHTLGVNLNEA